MNSLSATEIVNIAMRAGARKGRIEDLSSKTGDDGHFGRLYYKLAVQKLLSSYPWPTLTKRVELDRVAGKSPVESYDRFFQPPPDGAFFWDFYLDPTGFGTVSPVWNYTLYSYYSFPQQRGSSVIENVGEIIGDYFASDASKVFCLYTPKIEAENLDTSKLTHQFVQALISEIKTLWEEGSGTSDPDMYKARYAQYEKERSESKTQTGISNRKAYSIAGSTIVEKVRSYLLR